MSLIPGTCLSCSGSGGCECHLTEGDNVTITGTGAVDDPFIISAAGSVSVALSRITVSTDSPADGSGDPFITFINSDTARPNNASVLELTSPTTVTVKQEGLYAVTLDASAVPGYSGDGTDLAQFTVTGVGGAGDIGLGYIPFVKGEWVAAAISLWNAHSSGVVYITAGTDLSVHFYDDDFSKLGIVSLEIQRIA